MEKANQYAAQVPLNVMETAFETYATLRHMAQAGNPASITDVGVGALCVDTCIQGAALNVRINLGGIKNEDFKTNLAGRVKELLAASAQERVEIMEVVEGKM